MGILFAGVLQLILPLATCFPGMIYRVINPNLADPNAAYPSIVAAVVPAGFRGLVAAAVMAAIMSTIAGLVNSISTIVTLDIFRPWGGKGWTEQQLVQFGRWVGGAGLLIGALFAPVVMHWQSIFRYCQDLWAPMAAPVVTVFLAGALWKKAGRRGAVACLWLSIATVPLTFAKQILADRGAHFLPPNLENSLVFASSIFLLSIAIMALYSTPARGWIVTSATVLVAIPLFLLGAASPVAISLIILAGVPWVCLTLMPAARTATPNLWDRSMLSLPGEEPRRWYANLWLWWIAGAAAIGAIYVWLW